MNEGFISFKKKILKEHLTKCLILSISLGLIVFGGLFLLWKLQAISLPIWMVIIIPVACFIISFCGPYFLLKPCDKRIAKRLDHELKLNEKVQTMVDYKDSDEFIACLQREDTENKLKAISLKALKFNLPIALIVLGIIGVASTTTAVSIPMKHEQSPVEPEKPFTLTELQIKRIEEIIAKVKESNINSELTSSYENELNALIEKLKVITKQDTVNEEVLKTIEKITKEMNDTNKNKAIGKALNSIESTFYDDNGKFKPVSSRKNAFVGKWMTKDEQKKTITITKTLVNVNGKSYAFEKELASGNYKPGDTITGFIPGSKTESCEIIMGNDYITYNKENYYLYEGYTKIRDLGRAIYNFEGNLNNYFQGIKNDYSELSSGLYGWQYTYAKTIVDSTAIKTAIESTNLVENDYYKAFIEYSDTINTVQNTSVSKVLDLINEAVDTLEKNITKLVNLEMKNRDTVYYIEDELRDIFGLDPASRIDDKLEEDKGISSDDDSNKSTADKVSGGGYGEGETKYAHDDYFFHYDPSTGESTFYAYGKFYTTYQGYFEALSNEGVLTDEMREFIESYFNKLNTGLDSEKNKN